MDNTEKPERQTVYSDEQLAQWKKESPNGELYELEYKGQDYVFIAPGRQTVKRFTDRLPRSPHDAMTMVLMDCMKYPDIATYNAQLDKHPLLVSALFAPFSEAVGFDDQAQVKNV